MKKILCSILISAAVLSLSACGIPKPVDEKTIAADLISKKQDISTDWLYSLQDTTENSRYLPYQVIKLTIEKRDTNTKAGYDDIWFDFIASNGVHRYTGSGSASYRLYSQGGWIMENCSIDQYHSSPAGKPRVEEMLDCVWSMEDSFEIPQDRSADKFQLEQCYLDPKELPQEYQESDWCPQDEPIALFRYHGPTGPEDALYTPRQNPLYLLVYIPDAYDSRYDLDAVEEDGMIDPSDIGWVYSDMLYDDQSSGEEGKNEWRLYVADPSSAYGDQHKGLFAITIKNGQITHVDMFFYNDMQNRYIVFSADANDADHFSCEAADAYGLFARITGIGTSKNPESSDPEDAWSISMPFDITLCEGALTSNRYEWQDNYSETLFLEETKPLQEAWTAEQVIEQYDY